MGWVALCPDPGVSFGRHGPCDDMSHGLFVYGRFFFADFGIPGSEGRPSFQGRPGTVGIPQQMLQKRVFMVSVMRLGSP